MSDRQQKIDSFINLFRGALMFLSAEDKLQIDNFAREVQKIKSTLLLSSDGQSLDQIEDQAAQIAERTCPKGWEALQKRESLIDSFAQKE